MTEQEALKIINQACASVVANLETHQAIQEALRVIDEVLQKPKNK